MKPPIKNIYYMLSYAFKVLQKQEYKKIETEEFENVADLYSEILIQGINFQLKRGLAQEYIEKNEELSTLRGKIDISQSIKSQGILRKKLNCTFDEFSVNSYFNRVLKSTCLLLLKSDVAKERKQKLRKLLIYFADVDSLDIYHINWNFKYNKNNQEYLMLLSICNLIIKGLLHTTSDGSTKVMNYLDEQSMHRLYEKFILEYYKKEFKELSVNASQIDWILDNDYSNQLPIMQSDIILSQNNNVLIIDAKYYEKTMQVQYDKYSIHSHNLYQIFTYVKNKELSLKDINHKVSGMLLYAKTDSQIQPNNTYLMSGNKISVRTLDLNCEFENIKTQLNNIVNEYFNIKLK